MTNNELIAYAMEHYTEGTVYISRGETFTLKLTTDTYKVFYNKDIDAGEGLGYLRFSGVWAEIVQKEVEPDWSATDEEKHWLNECIKANKFIHKSTTDESFNEKKKFPKEGKCSNWSQELENYLIQQKGFADSKMGKFEATGIAWNENSYWWVKEFKNSSKPDYDLSDLYSYLSICKTLGVKNYPLTEKECFKSDKFKQILFKIKEPVKSTVKIERLKLIKTKQIYLN